MEIVKLDGNTPSAASGNRGICFCLTVCYTSCLTVCYSVSC